METIIVLVISGITALFVALPFFLKAGRHGTEGLENVAPDPVLERLKYLDTQKGSLFSAIRDMDFDYDLGKLTKEDFEELRKKYRIEAASVLKEIDDISKNSGLKTLERQIEDEIKTSRGTKSGYAREEGETEKEILRARKNPFSAYTDSRNAVNYASGNCATCGNQYGEEDLFCSKCGAKLNGEKEDKKATTL